MNRFLLYASIWTPGASAVAGLLIAVTTSRRFAAGDITHREGYDTILPWVWIPVFLLVPAAILGVALLFKMRWTALLQLGASVGLVIAWISFVDSGPILQQKDIEQAAPSNGG